MESGIGMEKRDLRRVWFLPAAAEDTSDGDASPGFLAGSPTQAPQTGQVSVLGFRIIRHFSQKQKSLPLLSLWTGSSAFPGGTGRAVSGTAGGSDSECGSQ